MINGVIFDMDGVLIDSEPAYLERRIHFCKAYHIAPKHAELEDFIGETNTNIWRKLIPDDLNTPWLKNEYKKYQQEHPINYLKILNPDVKEVFEELKKRDKKIAIASSSPKQEIERMVNSTGLRPYIDYIISGEEFKKSKPNPEIYLVTKKILGGGEYLAIEDSPIGILAAKQAELYTLALRQVTILDQSQADAVINSLQEIFQFI